MRFSYVVLSVSRRSITQRKKPCPLVRARVEIGGDSVRCIHLWGSRTGTWSASSTTVNADCSDQSLAGSRHLIFKSKSSKEVGGGDATGGRWTVGSHGCGLDHACLSWSFPMYPPLTARPRATAAAPAPGPAAAAAAAPAAAAVNALPATGAPPPVVVRSRVAWGDGVGRANRRADEETLHVAPMPVSGRRGERGRRPTTIRWCGLRGRTAARSQQQQGQQSTTIRGAERKLVSLAAWTV